MGLNFRKSISLGKGLRLNLGGKSSSISFGTKGARYSVSTSGKRRATVGIPGTGLSYTKTFGSKKEKSVKDKQENLKENQEAFEEYEQQVEEVKSIHEIGMNPICWDRSETIPRQVRNLQDEVLEKNIDAYYEVINELKPFDEIVAFGSEFEIGTDSPEYIMVEFNIKEEEVVPKTEVKLTETGKLSEKELSKSAYNELMQDYVCSVMLRLAHDLFAVLPVDKVIVHAVDERVNTATGHMEEATLVSVIFERDIFEKLNLEAIDPSDSLLNFQHNMKFTKTQGFKPVVKLTNF